MKHGGTTLTHTGPADLDHQHYESTVPHLHRCDGCGKRTECAHGIPVPDSCDLDPCTLDEGFTVLCGPCAEHICQSECDTPIVAPAR